MDLCGERRTATAGARRVGVFDHELRTLEAFSVVDLGADEILVAHRVDEQHHTVFLHHRVVVALYFVESKSVLKSGAAAAGDKQAERASLRLHSWLNSCCKPHYRAGTWRGQPP